MLLRFVAILASVAAAFAPVAPVHAATLSIEMPGCSTVSLSGQPPNYTLTCAPIASLCSMTVSAATPAVGTTVTLTVGCVPPATSLSWQSSRGCNAPVPVAGNPMQATVTQTSAVICIYTATAATSGTMSNAAVSWVGGGTAAPAGCQIGVTPSASLPAAGGNVTLTGSCSGGSPVTRWSWRRDLTNNVSSAQGFSDTLPANTNQAARTYTYGLTACAGAGQDVCAAEVIAPVQVAGSGPPVAGLCPGNAIVADMAWGISYITSGIGPGVMFSGRFTVPADSTPNTVPGSFYASEFGGSPANRLMTLSTQACDFRGYTPVYPIPQPVLPPGDPTGATGPLAWAGGSLTSTGPTIAFLLLGDPPGSPPKPFLTPGQTYYLNIQTVNWDLSNSCAGAGPCDMRINFDAPY